MVKITNLTKFLHIDTKFYWESTQVQARTRGAHHQTNILTNATDYTQQAEQGSADRRHTHVVLESRARNTHMTIININYYI